ncbi:XRE family transcriptional regulator [Pseudomonas aeruginosa]|uniref:XRE family transcriptional regulator n=1 Tax=Pseudomonas aeruginosa TaxID=287 RepID=UPI000BB86193|nr:XRE family transcriptional regulator [Pseudomonas aeruginosa]AXR09973.1 XRE family transcriptional regulator [Pseudomonas aeruginosa]EIU2598509.1 helix-turn-helix transcriptional regulator [Pseudomonas aeruginosa]EIU2879809.1 helix-turn-helix transcriptional regulator [Pseudomonas aeruginosa]ELC7283626.1 helix-turn-helix transcriptional regulator [Pseudomonas aeruginosa]ELK4865850.1 helix-turn-helix transcriptional regulator [Pseudomonas aeruginosa]
MSNPTIRHTPQQVSLSEQDKNDIRAGIAARLKKCASIAGSGDELARLSGVPRRTLEYYLTAERDVKSPQLLALARAVGVSLDWLIAGEEVVAPQAPELADDGTYAYIPLYDSRCSSGHGAWNERAQILTHLAFTLYSLHRKGLSPSDLACLRNDGDSMTGLIEDDDTIMIDVSRNVLSGEGVYVILLDDHLYAKRLQRQFDGSVHIISHNKEYQVMAVPKDRLAELQIVGRAVWAGGWLI